MNKFKGSPEPWALGNLNDRYVTSDSDGEGFYAKHVWVLDKSGKIIGEAKGFSVGGFVSPDVVEANARLLVAAPDLLKALQMLVALTDPKDGGCPEINQAHEAITKALGE